MKEWKCALHGSFDGTHPICPTLGCMSENVEREFRTPPGVSKGLYQRFDAGLRRSAERMKIDNWRTARAGETAFAGRGTDAPIGTEVLWGAEAVQKTMGVSFAAQMQAAAQPLNLPAKGDDPYVRVNNGMRAAANTIGITKSVLPKAEITAPMSERKPA